jgi:Zn-dependent protease/CBS domain-containing protein
MSDSPDRHRPQGGTWRIATLAGVPVGLHPLWLVIVGLLTFSLGETWFPARSPGIAPEAAYALGLLSALLLFGGILLHELGHAIVARRRGVEVDEIDLWLLGGVARLRGEPRRPQDELRFALAGPAVTFALALAFGAARLAAGAGPDWLRALLDYQVQVSALILAFNLLPAFPLDGGRVLRSLLWWRSGDHARATRDAAGLGRLLGLLIIALGAFSFAAGVIGGLWLVLVGGFLVVAAAAEAQAGALRALLAGVRVEELMSRPAATIPGASSVADAVAERVLPALHTSYPVEDRAGRAIGIVRLDALRAIPADQRRSRLVAPLADRDPDLLVAPEALVTELIARPAFGRVGRAVVVAADGTVAGIVSVTDLERLRMVRSLQAAPALEPGARSEGRVAQV